MHVSLRHLIVAVFACFLLQNEARSEDWPWFLGPRHDGTSAEAGLKLQWPKTGPNVAWKQAVGTGYSAPSILGDRLVVHHRRKNEELISCHAVSDGSLIWEHKYPSNFKDPYGYNNGPRCSPVLIDSMCYTLGAEGMLCCTGLDSGKVIWQKDLQEFDLPSWFFGIGCSPLVDGENLYVLVGGQPNSGVVCFNRLDGAIRWQHVGKETWNGVTDIHTGKPYEWTDSEMLVSYSSPILEEIHGKQHLLCLMRQGLVSLDPQTGEQNFCYWFRPKVNDSVNAARPVVVNDKIFLSAAYRLGSALLQVNPDGKSFTEVWKDSDNMLAHWSTPIHVDGYIYGFSGRHENEGELRCIRLSDGEVMWATPGFEGNLSKFGRDRTTGQIVDIATKQPVPFPYFGRGSLIRVGDRFVVLGERGTLAVVHVDPQDFKEDCRHSFPEIQYPAWAAPVIANGALYLRSEKWLLNIDLKQSSN